MLLCSAGCCAHAVAAMSAAAIAITRIASLLPLVSGFFVIRLVDVLVRRTQRLARLAVFAAKLDHRLDAGAVEAAILLQSFAFAHERVPRLARGLLARLRQVLPVDRYRLRAMGGIGQPLHGIDVSTDKAHQRGLVLLGPRAPCHAHCPL